LIELVYPIELRAAGGLITRLGSIFLKLRVVQNKILRPVNKKSFFNILLHRVCAHFAQKFPKVIGVALG